jgi:arginyl-tRNA--protein-N-Asp/Glu arginylyltransferase
MTELKVTDLFRFVAQPSVCSYLREETSQLEYRVPLNLDEPVYGELVRRGWRRFGNYVFRPQCPVCRKCRSLRVRVDDFRRSKSLRRTLNRNSGVDIESGPPTVTNEHVVLFNAWHRDMTRQRGWPENATSIQDYYESFIGGRFEFAREFRYFDGERLVGVSLVDVVATGVSSVYFFHDPVWRRLAPGTFSILTEIEFARDLGLPFVYLGYWIEENRSMNYKSRFVPHQLLESYVDDDAEPVWRLPVDRDSASKCQPDDGKSDRPAHD